MALFSVGVRTAAAAAGAPYLDLRTGTALNSPRAAVREIGIFLTAATLTQLTLARQSTLGTTSTQLGGQATDPGDSATTVVVGTVWSVVPAAFATPLRRVTLPGSIGAGIIWTFGPRELVVPTSGSLILTNVGAAAGPILDAYISWEE